MPLNKTNKKSSVGEAAMPDQGSGTTLGRIATTSRWIAVLAGVLLAGVANPAPGNNRDVVRDLAGRGGPVVGSALACTDIARPRIQTIVDKFAAVIRETSANEAERAELTHLLNRSVADGRSAVAAGKIDCRLAERQLADLERSIAGPV